MISPIAQHTVAVKRLQAEVAEKEKALAEQKEILLKATAKVKSGEKELCYGGQTFPVDLVKKRIAQDFKAYQRLERTLEARRTELSAKETTLKATQEQLQSFISKKKEFEVILAGLEADHEVNHAAAIGSDIRIDDTRAAHIAKDLEELKTKIETQRTALEMRKGIVDVSNIRLDQPQANPGVDLDAIQ